MKILATDLTDQDRQWIQDLQAADFRLDFPWIDQGQMWGLRIEGRLVAFIFYRHLPLTAEVLSLAVHPDFRRQGHLKRLFQELIKGLKNNAQVSEIWLEVHVQNRAAIGLYESLGFIQQGRRKSYYPDGGDALLMSKNI